MCRHLPRTVLLSSNGHIGFIKKRPSAYGWPILFVLESKAWCVLRGLITRGSWTWFFLEKKPWGKSTTILETSSMCSTALYVEQPESMVWLLFVSVLPLLSHFCFLVNLCNYKMHWINQTEETNGSHLLPVIFMLLLHCRCFSFLVLYVVSFLK